MNVYFQFNSPSANSTAQGRLPAIAAGLLLSAIAVAGPAVRSANPQTAASTRQSSSTSPGDPQNGQTVFKREGCDRCHGSQGEGLAATDPNAGLTRIVSTTRTLPAFVQLVRQPKGRMPPFGSKQVSDMELTDVYAFLHSSKAPAQSEVSVSTNAKNGRQLFAKYGCSECHMSMGQGARSTGVRLGPPQIPLSAFTSYVRQPTGEMPPYTQKTVSNDELADIYTYLRSVPPTPAWKTIPLLNQ